MLSVFRLENGEVEFVVTSEIGMLCNGNNIYALPTDPENILLDSYDGSNKSVFTTDKTGVPTKS